MYEYENLKRVSYDCGDEFGEACFVPVCPKCGRFVKSDEDVNIYYSKDGALNFEANATRYEASMKAIGVRARAALREIMDNIDCNV